MADEPNKDEIAVEIVEKDDKTPAKDGKKPAGAAVAAGSNEESIDTLKKQLEDERAAKTREQAARIDAEKRASDASQREASAKNAVDDSNMATVNIAIESVKGSMASLKANYASYAAAGEWDKAADVQSAMATNAAKLLQLETGKEELKTRPKRTAPPIADPVERYANNLEPRTADWVRAHPEYFSSGNPNDAVLGAHHYARSKGHKDGSEGYFDAVETQLGLKGAARAAAAQGNEDEGESPFSDAGKPVQRRTPPPAAPVTRSGAAPGQNPRTIRLSADEAEMARLTNQSPEDYYKNKQALRDSGRLN